MSIAGYIASKTRPPQVPETGAGQYRDVYGYDPVLQSHCRLSDGNVPRKNEDRNAP